MLAFRIKYKESDGISSSPLHRVLISTAAAVTISNISVATSVLGGREEGGRDWQDTVVDVSRQLAGVRDGCV